MKELGYCPIAPSSPSHDNTDVESQERPNPFRQGTLSAIAAAFAFGVTTPLIQRAGRSAGPLPTAAFIYAGAALASIELAKNSREAELLASRLPRLFAVAILGAVAAPTLLAWGLQRTGAAGASLLLNFEALFTVLLGWFFFREHLGRRIVVAAGLMAGGGACLLTTPRADNAGWGALAVILATFAWALDNLLTRPLADLNPTAVVRWKASLGALSCFALSLVARQSFPPLRGALVLLVCGATGYGFSLRLYLRAQRMIGAGRTASVFAVAPFVGAAVAAALGDRTLGAPTLAAAALFGAGIYLHLTEMHRHRHSHEPTEHEHAHRHDDGHHDHLHTEPVLGEHSHPHRHEAQTHDHVHGPDLHHGHRH